MRVYGGKKNSKSADAKMLICPLCLVTYDLNYQVCEVSFIPCFGTIFFLSSGNWSVLQNVRC